MFHVCCLFGIAFSEWPIYIHCAIFYWVVCIFYVICISRNSSSCNSLYVRDIREFIYSSGIYLLTLFLASSAIKLYFYIDES